MQRIFLDEAKPSMVLAAAVKDEQNNVLFLRGAELKGHPFQEGETRQQRLS